MEQPQPRFRSTFVGIDLEATDLSTDGGKIIEAAAVRFTDGREVASFTALVDPGEPIPPIITSITGIRDQDVLGKPSFGEVRDELAAFIGDAPVIGHNVQFDVGFLAANGLKLKNPTYDTWRLATLLLPRASSHSLESLAAELKLNHPEAHRALHDARVGAELFVYLTDVLGKVDPATARRLLALVERHPFSLTPVFREVFDGTAVPTAAKVGTPRTRRTRSAKPTTGQPALPLRKEEPVVPGWTVHHDHAGERLTNTAADYLDVADLQEIFEHKLPAAVPGFELRPAQVSTARELLTALRGSKKVVIEAPPGAGRREAALIAGSAREKKAAARTFYAASGRRELAAVAERADQLAAAGSLASSSVTVLGEPADYVSIDALERFTRRAKLDENEVQLMAKITLWLPTTKTGNLDELSLTWEEKNVAGEVTSKTHACSKKHEHQKCSYCDAFLRSAEADLVIVTHRTLLGLLERTELEKSDRIVVDDAQLFEDAATEAFGSVLRQDTIERTLDHVAQEGDGALSTKAEAVRSHLTLLAGLIGVFVEGERVEASWAGVRTVVLNAGHGAEPSFKRVNAGLETLVSKLAELRAALGSDSLLPRAFADFERDVRALLAADPAHNVVQVQLNDRQQFVLRSQPVEVQQLLQERLFARTPSVVLLGPRLTVERRFSYLRERLGVPKEVREVVVPSPKGLAERTAIVAVSDHPDPMASRWVEATGQAIAQVSATLRGRVLVVFSSRSSILGVHGVVETMLAGTGTKLLAQGLSGGRGKTVQTLKRHERAVLMTSYNFVDRTSFRHGFSAVILVRLPFSVPTEPLTAARKARLASGFRELELPRVALKVREQFDRIVEDAHDRGVLIVLDQKFQKDYGSVFLESLPDVPTHVVPGSKLAETVEPFAGPVVEKPKRA